jgi:WD40 repeat protein
MINENLLKPINNFLSLPDKNVLLIINEQTHYICKILKHLLAEKQYMVVFVDPQSSKIIDPLFTDASIYGKKAIIFEYSLNSSLENIYIKYQLERWNTKVVVVCHPFLIHPSFDPGLYFAPINGRKIQRNFVNKVCFTDISLKQIQSIAKQSKIEKEAGCNNLTSHFLNQKLMTDDLLLMQMLADRVLENKAYQNFLFEMVLASRNKTYLANASANAITTLNYAKIPFTNCDFSAVNITGADLTGASCDHTNFQAANLQKVSFHRAWLRSTDFRRADMDKADFGELPPINLSENVNSIAGTLDGKYLAVASRKTAYVYDLTTSKVTPKHFVTLDRSISKLAISPDGEYLVIKKSMGNLFIHKIKTKQTFKLFDFEISLHECGLSFSPADMGLLTIGLGNFVFLLELADIKQPGIFLKLEENNSARREIRNISFSPDGKYLAFVTDTEFYLCHVQTKTILSNYKAKAILHGLAYSFDGKLIACSSQDRSVHLINAITGDLICELISEDGGWCWAVAFDMEGRILASGGDSQVINFWDIKERIIIKKIYQPRLIWQLLYLPYKQAFASSCDMGNAIRFWPINTIISNKFADDNNISKFHMLHGSARTLAIAFNPYQEILAAINQHQTLCLWDISSGKVVNILEYPKTWHGKRGIAYSTDGKMMAVVLNDAVNAENSFNSSKLYVWNTFTWACRYFEGNKLVSGNVNPEGNPVFSPNNKWIATANYFMVLFWEVQTGVSQAIPINDASSSEHYKKIAFSPNGFYFAAASIYRLVRLWSLDENQFPQNAASSQRVDDELVDICFNSTGEVLAVAGKNSIYLWKVPPARCIGTPPDLYWYSQWEKSNVRGDLIKVAQDELKIKNDIDCIAFAVKSPSLLAVGQSNFSAGIFEVEIWDITSGKAVSTLSWFNGNITMMAWRQMGEDLILAVGDNTNTVYCFRLTQSGKLKNLLWRSRSDTLVLKDALIEDTILDKSTANLFKFYGAHGKPVTPEFETTSPSHNLAKTNDKLSYSSAMKTPNNNNTKNKVSVAPERIHWKRGFFNQEKDYWLKKYNLSDKSPKSLEKALRQAAANNQIDDLKLLIQRVDINSQDDNPKNKKTALHWATLKGSTEVVSLLLNAGAKFDILDAENKTAFDYAQLSGSNELIELYLEKLGNRLHLSKPSLLQ